MTEVLDQTEIDALLAAAATNAEAARPAAGSAASAAQIESRAYDFKRPERVSKDQIRALGTMHEGFARNFGATLSGFLRTIIDVRVVDVEQLTYSEFVNSVPNPTCFVIVQAPPLEGQMCLELSPLIIYPIIDRLLGGTNAEVFIPPRPLTSIEWRLIKRMTDRAMEHLSEAWRGLVDLKFEVVETESNPQLVHVVAPTEVVVFITFEIKMGHCAGTMSLCMPFNVIEPVTSQLTRQSWIGYRAKDATETHVRKLTRNIMKSRVGLKAYLAESTITLNQFRAMRAGDILALDKRVGSDLVIQIEGRNKFAGTLGQQRGRRAIAVRRAAEADEPL